MPPAPPTFSTIIACPKYSDRRGARIRPKTSGMPPAANGTTSVMGRLGQSCADPGAAAATVMAAVMIAVRLQLIKLPILCPQITDIRFDADRLAGCALHDLGCRKATAVAIDVLA